MLVIGVIDRYYNIKGFNKKGAFTTMVSGGKLRFFKLFPYCVSRYIISYKRENYLKSFLWEGNNGEGELCNDL